MPPSAGYVFTSALWVSGRRRRACKQSASIGSVMFHCSTTNISCLVTIEFESSFCWFLHLQSKCCIYMLNTRQNDAQEMQEKEVRL